MRATALGRPAEVGTEAWERDRLDALDRLDVLDTPPEPEFDRIARLIKNIFGVDIAIVSMIDAHRQWYKACIGMPVSEVPRNESFCKLTIREAEPVIAPDATRDPRFRDSPYVQGEPFIRFYAGVQLRTSEGHAIGTLCAIDSQPHDFGDREIDILRDLAAVVMTEVELKQLAATDVLTGALSRRAFKEDGANAVALSQRHDNHLSCIAVDLDYFKKINDTYGHAAGDKVLTVAAGILKEHLRQSDIVARIGGEEFAILLPHTSQAGALEAAEKLRQRIEATAVDIGGRKIGVTASFGVSQLDSDAKDIDSLLARADTALYEAKAKGRNKCVVWPTSGVGLRRRVLKAGEIHSEENGTTVDCTVRFLSQTGARLAVSHAADIPASFRLVMPSESVERECRVTERAEQHVEVEFR